jgi:hypothetical protein
MGAHSIRAQKARFEDEILEAAGRTIPALMPFIFCRLSRSETGVGNSRCLLPSLDSNARSRGTHTARLSARSPGRKPLEALVHGASAHANPHPA